MFAVQGPEARAQVTRLLSSGAATALWRCKAFWARSSSDGSSRAPAIPARMDSKSCCLPGGDRRWRKLNELGVVSCGLGARDTLRLEAGMNLYGNDMDETTHPLESGLAWTVAMQSGRSSLHRPRGARRHPGAGVGARLVGLCSRIAACCAATSECLCPSGPGEGQITSGTYSPTLERSIALARVPAAGQPAPAARVQVDIRGKLLDARVVKPPFVRLGKSLLN